jgi:hypothetical protein
VKQSALRQFLNQGTLRDSEPEFKIRARVPLQSNAEAHALTGFKRVMQDLLFDGAPGPRGAAKPARSFNTNQRCAVRVSYSPNKTRGQWRAHGRQVSDRLV